MAAKPKCALLETALREVEREAGARARCWSHVQAAIDPRYANLWLLPDATVLVVPGGEVRGSDYDLVSEPSDHLSLESRLIIYAHHWAKVSGPPDDEMVVEVRLVDDGTCAHAPEVDTDPLEIAMRRHTVGCYITGVLLALPCLAKWLWSVPLLLSLPLLFILLSFGPPIWMMAQDRRRPPTDRP